MIVRDMMVETKFGLRERTARAQVEIMKNDVHGGNRIGNDEEENGRMDGG